MTHAPKIDKYSTLKWWSLTAKGSLILTSIAILISLAAICYIIIFHPEREGAGLTAMGLSAFIFMTIFAASYFVLNLIKRQQAALSLSQETHWGYGRWVFYASPFIAAIIFLLVRMFIIHK